MRKYITSITAALLLIPAAASAQSTVSASGRQEIATAAAAHVAKPLSAYYEQLSVQRFRNRDAFTFYAAWRDRQGQTCKFVWPLTVVVYRHGFVRVYNANAGNTVCSA